ncbi:MAG: LCP family protein [Peptoniphilaceae bacterium]|nr:LCP family protein [Peptoniphilaceae bacterium]MDY6085249.1 LCP family protein [Peptoniphilaceae bacterium]
MKTIKNLTIFLGIMLYLLLAGILFYYDFLPLEQRLFFLGVALILNLLLMIGVANLRRMGAVVTFLMLFLVMFAEGGGSYLVWSSMETLSSVSVNDPAGRVNAANGAHDELAPFHIFLSGKDTYGPLETESRSDVNMILTVNPRAHRIEITTIPRDSYMRIAGEGYDEYDKLTHAGIYGVSASVETLENFFDIDIQYYAEVNFSSLVELVDLLGGIDLYNPEYFTTAKYEFDEGNLHLDGAHALSFARERKHLRAGELGRGQNHVRIIKAIIDKAMSPAILTSYPSILQVISDKVRTNMPQQSMVTLINYQLAHNESWETTSSQLKGFETNGLPSFQIPDMELYMFVPSRASRRNLLDIMQAVAEDAERPESSETYELMPEDYADLPVSDFGDYLQNDTDQERYYSLQEMEDDGAWMDDEPDEWVYQDNEE